MVTIKIPALPRGMGSNLLGLVGLVAVVVSVGGLTGNWWWSGLLGGLVCAGMAVLAQYSASTQNAGEEPTQQIPRIGAA
jgi:hypothetical protein